MEQALQAAGVCVAGAALALVVRRGSPETALLLVLGTAVAVLLSLGEGLGQLTDFLRQIRERSGLPGELFTPLCKTVGIALVVRIGGSLCRDAGESALAETLDTAGAVCALTTALPLLRAVWDLLTELMG